MQNVNSTSIRPRHRVSDQPCAVGASVVNDQDMYIGMRAMYPRNDRRQILALVVCRDDRQRIATRSPDRRLIRELSARHETHPSSATDCHNSLR
jgi:hypothetical protein